MISTTERHKSEPVREHARIPCAIPVELTHDEHTPGFEADAVDLSAGGLSLRSENLPEVGAKLYCRFETLPGGTRISGRGEVVWAKPSGERSGEFGLRFTHIDARAQALITEMIAERVATGGAGTPPQPRMATLEFEENEGPITAKLTRAAGRDVVFEQPLDVLALGRSVVAHAGKTLGHGNILRVDLKMDRGTPTLALTVRFSKEQEDYGEYDWADGGSGPQLKSDGPREVDTTPDLASPIDAKNPQPTAAEGVEVDPEASRTPTRAGGTSAPAQDSPAPHVPTHAGGTFAPPAAADPLSPEAVTAALARLAAEEQAELARAELGTPLAAARAARIELGRDTDPNFSRDSELRIRPASSPGSEPPPTSAVMPGAKLSISQLVQPRDTDPSAPPEASRITPPIDLVPEFATTIAAPPAPHADPAAARAKQMALTFAPGPDEDFVDAEDEDLLEHDESASSNEAISVLETETLAGDEDRHAQPPMQVEAANGRSSVPPRNSYGLGAGWGGNGVPSSPGDVEVEVDSWNATTETGEIESPSSPGAQWASSSPGDQFGPLSESANKSGLVRFLRIVAAMVDALQNAFGSSGRVLKRAGDSVVPVLRRQIRRHSLRSVGRVRRAGAPGTSMAWKLPKGSGRLVLLAVLMLGCGILLVYAFPRSNADQVELHRKVDVGDEATADTLTDTNAAVDSESGAASASQGVMLGAKAPPSAAGARKQLAMKAGAAQMDEKLPLSTVFGAALVANGQRFIIRTTKPVTSVHGKSDPGGFSVTLPNTTAIDKAAPIARSSAAVSRAKVINHAGYAELSVRFAEGRSPAYRVSAQPAGLEVLIGP